MTEEVDIGLKRPATICLTIVDQVLMLTGEVDIGLRLGILTPITQLGVVECRVSHFLLVLLTKIFMVMREMDISLRTATLPPIT